MNKERKGDCISTNRIYKTSTQIFIFSIVSFIVFICAILDSNITISKLQDENNQLKTDIQNVQSAYENEVSENEKLNEEIKTLNETISSQKEQINEQNNKIEELQTQDTPTQTQSMNVPSGDTSFKSYTYYTCISRNSAQWDIQEMAYTDENGLRKIDNDYLVAMGSYYTDNLGDRFEITLSSGNTFTVRICDFKDDAHTNSTHQYSSNRNVIEFYVDKSLNSKAKQMGDISYIDGFEGSITKITKL